MLKYSKFAIVGGVGFIADASVYGILSYGFSVTGFEIDPLITRVVAFWFAASVTWLGNRYFTFSNIAFSHRRDEVLGQFMKHMTSAHFSGILNIASFYFLLAHTGEAYAFVIGVLVGTVTNYFLSSKMVFVR